MNRCKGFTLLEVLIVVAIIAILAGMAVPSYNQMIESNNVKYAAESIKADLQFARTEALKRSANVVVSFDEDAWCYGLDTAACDCSTDGDCAVKAISSTQFNNITLDSSNNTTFSFRRGTANAGNACVSSSNYQLKIVVSNLGRVKICNPSPASTDVAGFNRCATIC